MRTCSNDINLPREIAAALNEFSSAVAHREWRRLPAAAGRAADAEEEDAESSYPRQIARLTDLLKCEDRRGNGRDVGHELFPEEFWEERGVARVRAQEELEVAARDGCTAHLLRPVDLEIAARATKLVVTSVRHGPPSWPAFVIPGWGGQIAGSLWFARTVLQADLRCFARFAERSLTSQRIYRTVSVGVDANADGPRHQSIVSWAAAEAVARWNRVADGITELRLATGQARPDLLIRAHAQPSVSGYDGLFRSGKWLGRDRDRAELGIVEVVSAGSGAPSALPRSPEKVRYTIEHELGHFYGFDDCVHDWGVMGGHGWDWPYPRPGRGEQYALRRRFELTQRYEKRLGRMQRGRLRQRAARSLPEPAPLDEEPKGEAPVPRVGGRDAEWVEAIWQGERFTAARDDEKASACFLAALEQSPAEAALRLGTIALWREEPEACIRWLKQAQEEAPPWWRHEWEGLHATLAEAYTSLGDATAARRHHARAARHAADRELLHQWCTVTTHPRWALVRPWRPWPLLRAALRSASASLRSR